MHHSPSGPSLRTRLHAFHRLRFPRPSLRGTIAPAVLVCGLLAGVALVLPSYAPAVTGTDGALGSTHATSAGAPGSGSSGRAGRSERAEVVTPEVAAAPSSTMPAPAPVLETPPAEKSRPAAELTQSADAASPSSSPPAEPSSPAAPSSTSDPSTPDPSTPDPSTPVPSTPVPSAPEPSAPVPSAPVPSAPSTAPVAGTADANAEGKILALVNQQRAAAGCSALTADEGLASVARAFSADMRDRGFFSHTDPDGLSPFDRGDRAGVSVLAENIAQGRPDPASVMTAWMNSAGHRANVLNCSYTRLGVGVAYGPGGPWWTQDFA